MSEYIVELDSKHSIALRLAFAEEMRGGDFVRGEIVRCRDCKWYHEEWNRKLRRDTIFCDWLNGAHVEPDGFCAWGERQGE